MNEATLPSDLFEKSRDRKTRLVSHLMAEHGDLIAELKTIPHLRLKMSFDLELLRGELARIDGYVPHEVERSRGEDFVRQYQDAWHGRGLIDFTPDSRLAMTQTSAFPEASRTYNEDGSTRMFVTDLGERMPYAVSSVRSICKIPGRTRVAKIVAGKSMIWHTHCQLKTYAPLPYVFGIVHIPIVSNPHVRYQVAPVGPHRDGDPVWEAHYKPGEVWMFNGWHDHRVVNDGNDDRISVISYCSLTNPSFRERVAEAVSQYDGPRIT